MAGESDRTQDLLTRIGALQMALEATLAELIVSQGKDAREKIETLRDDLISRFKNSSISAERELEHAKIVGPAIEVLDLIFNSALRKL
jgi:chemotaxis regulatin CheY-phosphate phosphatase CheZ